MISTNINCFWILLSILASNLIYQADAIKCFQCNSFDDNACIDLPKNRERIQSYNKECVQKDTSIENLNPICTKLDLKIASTNDHRIIRECSWRKIEDAEYINPICFNANNDGYTNRICHCKDEGCNGANTRTNILGGTLILGIIFNIIIQYVVRT